MRFMLPIGLSILVSLLVLPGCRKSHSVGTKQFLKQEESLLARYCGPDLKQAEQAILRLQSLARSEQANGNPSFRYDAIYGQTYGRLFMIYAKTGEQGKAQEALELCKKHSRAMTGAPADSGTQESWIESIKKIDYGLDVKWKTATATSP